MHRDKYAIRATSTGYENPGRSESVFRASTISRTARERSIINKSIVGTRRGVSYLRASARARARYIFPHSRERNHRGKNDTAILGKIAARGARAPPLVNFAPFNSIWKVSRGNSIEISFIHLSKSGTSYRAC